MGVAFVGACGTCFVVVGTVVVVAVAGNFVVGTCLIFDIMGLILLPLISN